jgi:hypothetical protein
VSNFVEFRDVARGAGLRARRGQVKKPENSLACDISNFDGEVRIFASWR